MAEKAIKQQTFAWEGRDQKGKRVKGEMTGTSPTLIKADLKRRGIRPSKVRVKTQSPFRRKGKVTAKDIAIFSRQLATMISSGVPLVQGLGIIEGGYENPAMRELVGKIRTDVESGSSLFQALSAHPQHFDTLYRQLVNAGEQAGVLETVLNKIAAYKEKTEAIKSKIKKALIYPAAIIVAAFIVTAILLLFVIPQFQELFSSFGADLPALTRMVINLSDYFQKNWYLIFGSIGAVVVAFQQAHKRSQKVRDETDRILLKAPIFGPIIRKAAIARYARTLSTMFAAGVPLVDALDSVSGATGNAVYGYAVQNMKDEVSTGTQLNTSMEQSQLFPTMAVQMVAIGEESGALDTMLNKIADFYEQEVDDAVEGLSSMMEPLIIGVLGVLVGGLVIAMYLPIFQMGAVV